MYLPNPLDAFRSYSTHHILLACRSTVSAEPFTDNARNVQALEAINKTKKLGDPVTGHSDVFLVIDTRRFAQFTIDTVKYDVWLNGLKNMQSHANFASELQMTILDSVGISFFNFTQWLQNEQMECNFDGVVFMLRTIFVGHLEDGTSTTVHSLTIPLHLTKMDINLDFSKGVYNLAFWPNMNFDVDKQQRWTHIGQASTYFTGQKVNKLGPLISSLEERLNDRSLKFYEKINGDNPQGGGNFGRKVSYMITIPEHWENFDFNGSSEGAATETVFKRQLEGQEQQTAPGAQSGAEQEKQVLDSHVNVKTGINITEVLDIIFGQVLQIKLLGIKNSDVVKAGATDPDGSVTFYKYITGITSNDDTVTVHVDVVEFKVPNKLAMTSPADTVRPNDSEFYREENGKKLPNNFITYDYIFTGKNKDILNFDLKIENVHWLLASNIKVGAGEYFNISDNGINANKETTARKKKQGEGIRRYDPILMPQTTKAEEINFSSLSTATSSSRRAYTTAVSQEYTKNLTQFYAMAPIESAITIKGNPLLFSKFSISEMPSHTLAATNLSNNGGAASITDKSGYRADLEERILKKNPNSFTKTGGTFKLTSPIDNQSYATAPVFVKLNIKGPNVNDLTNEMFVGGDFTKEILTDVYFVVFRFTNTFEHGTFTQDLQLTSHNVFSGSNEKLTASDINPPKKV